MGSEVDNKLKIIFIGGTGRSGTNIAKKIFLEHSRVSTLPFEYRFIIDPEGVIDFYNSFSSTWSPFMADHKIKKFEKFLQNFSKTIFIDSLAARILRYYDESGKKITPKPYVDWKLNEWLPEFESHSKKLIEDLKDFEYNGCWPGAEGYSFNYKIYHTDYKDKAELSRILGGFISTIIRELLNKVDKDVFMEDNTWNILFARELLELVPEAKIIHVYRDPRDVIASYIHQRWSPSNVAQATLWYQSIMNRWFSIRKEISLNSYLEVKLEDLVGDTRTVLNKVCEFIDLPFEENLLRVDLGMSNTGRWKKEFSEADRIYVDNQLKDILDLLDYK